MLNGNLVAIRVASFSKETVVISPKYIARKHLRTVPTIVTAHTLYVLRISRYSGFLWVVPTNTGIFLCGLKLCRES